MLVVFDLDGTVIDSSRALLQAHDAALRTIGIQRPSCEASIRLEQE
jgi:beta-phosphoglucomutase-like phosphatase (HAD superfamily)